MRFSVMRPGWLRHKPTALFDRNRFGEVPRLINVATTTDGDVIGQQLQRHDLENGQQKLRRRRYIDEVVYRLFDLFVAFSGYGNHLSGPRLDFLDVGNGFLV